MQQNKIETVCLNCVFASGNHEPDKMRQTGCHMSVIEKFREQGAEIVDAIDEKENEFYVTKDRLCPFYRTYLWQKTMTIEEAKKKVREESHFKTSILIYFDDNDYMDELIETMESLSKCKKYIDRVIVINNSELRGQLTYRLLSLRTELPWSMETILEENASYTRCIDIVIKKLKTIYVTLIPSGHIIIPETFSDIDKNLYEDLQRTMVIYGHHYVTFMRILYRNCVKHVRQKILVETEELAKEETWRNHTMTLSQLQES